MRAINLGIILTQPTTVVTVELPIADATATAGFTSSSNQPFKPIPLTNNFTRFAVELSRGQYALIVESTIRPGESGLFRIATDQDATFWTVQTPDPGTNPRPFAFGISRSVIVNDPKNPWPTDLVATATPAIATSPILEVMNNLVDNNPGRGADPTQVPPMTYALLIGIDRYPPGPGQGGATYSDLHGCVADVLNTERMLKSKLSRLTVVQLLAPLPDGPGHELEIPSDRVPTYANIVAAWQRIAAVATQNDLIYIHYSGHGGRVKTLFPDIKAGRVDESIVPTDINDRKHGRYLRDFEIAVLLQQLAEREVNTTVVLDSCHSGSFTRGDQVQARTRGDGLADVDPRDSDALASAVASEDELRAVAARLETSLSDTTWKVRPDGTQSSTVTVIAACRATEGAYEYAPEGETRCGALTYHWCRALEPLTSELSYRQAFARVFHSVHGAFPQQTPVLLGDATRSVLDKKVLLERPALHVKTVSGNDITLDAGRSSLLVPEMRLAIVPPGQPLEHVELATKVQVEVATVGDDSATATRVTDTGGDAPIEVNAIAVVRSYPPRMQRAVRVIGAPPFSDALTAAISADPTKLLTVVMSHGGDYQVIIDPGTRQAEICDASGAPLLFVPRTSIDLADAAATLTRQLVHIARFSNVREFSNDAASAVLANKVSIELFQLPLSDPKTPAVGTLFVEDGKPFRAEVTNTSKHNLVVDILNLRPDWSVVRLTTTSRDLDSGQTLAFDLRAGLTFPDAPATQESLKVLATLDTVDASLLTLPVLGELPPDRGVRGPHDPPLQELFRILQDPLVAGRKADLISTPTSRWMTTSAAFTATRKQLGDAAVRDALGGSLATEELRGDFFKARAAAASAGGFEQILVDAITGRTGSARRALAALPAPQGDVAAQLIQRRLAMFADTVHFTEVSGRAAAMFDDLVGRWALDATHPPRTEEMTIAGPTATRALRVLDAINGVAGARSVIADDARVVPPEGARAARLAAHLADARGRIAALSRELEGVEAPPCSTTWLALADADLVGRSGDAAAALALIRAERARCDADRDGHGAAQCWLAEGDLRACVIESPATLALWIDGSAVVTDSATGPRSEALEQTDVDDAEFAAAREAVTSARQRFVEAAAPRGVAAADLRLAGIAALAGKYDDARELASSAERQFADAGDDCQRWLARIHGVLANVAQRRAVPPAALAEIAAWGDGDGDLAYAMGLAGLLARAGRRWLVRDAGYEQAVRCAKLAEQLFRALGAPLSAARSLGDQVTAHQMVHQRGAAVAAAQRADDLLASLGSQPVPDLSIARRRTLFEHRAWSLALNARDADGMERFAAQLRGTASDLGDPSTSVEFRKLIEQALQTTTALAPGYRAAALELEPRARPAVRTAAWQAAEDAVETLPEPDRWYQGALVKADRGDRPAAAALFARYFDADPTGARELPPNPNPELIRQAQAEHAGIAFSAFVRMRDAGRARPQLEILRELGGETWWETNGDGWQTLAQFGDLQFMEGDAPGALQSYTHAGELVEKQGAMLIDDSAKVAFADSLDAQRLFAHAAHASLALGTPDLARAFDFLERGRARALADLLSDRQHAPTGDDPIARWHEANARRDQVRAQIASAQGADIPNPARIEKLQHTLDEREQEVTELAEQARAASPERFQALDTRAAVAALSQIVESIPAGVVVIELSVVDSLLIGWSITNTGIVTQLCREIDDRALRRDALGFQIQCSTAAPSLAIGEGLAADLVGPFSAEIRAASQVVFVVSGELARVPFQALPFDGDALIARVAVSYAPSASLLPRLLTVPVPGVPAVIVGDPPHMVLRDPDGLAAPLPLPELLGARQEAKEIAALVPGSRLLIDDATADNVTNALPSFRVVHLATHGIADPASPWRSAVMLANGEQLSVSDLMGVTLAADLVVLSACSSAVGELTHGEEVIGLARGLLAAGARAVIVSLWNVRDDATRILMVELHRQLQSGARPAGALCAAQRHVRKLNASPAPSTPDSGGVRSAVILGEVEPLPGFAHPAAWAPFVLIGV